MTVAVPRQPEAVVLVRHGATDWSESFRHTGWTDIPLNSTGAAQARLLSKPLSRWSFSLVLSSPLQRARATCIDAGYGSAVEIDPDLREWNYGDYEGLTAGEIRRRRPGWSLWDDGVVNGETLADVGARADRVLARLRAASGTIAVFSHGHMLRVLAARWIGLEPVVGRNLGLATGAISAFGWEHSWESIALWNQSGHLDAAAAPAVEDGSAQ